MKINQTTLQHLADLAALELDQSEQSRLVDELNNILVYVERIQHSSFPDPTHRTPVGFRRPDEPASCNTETLFEAAPELTDDLFCTPLVTENLDEGNHRADGES